MFVMNDTISWGVRSPELGSRSRLRCGQLLVEFSRGDDDVCLASKTLSVEESESDSDPDEPVAWTSWAVCTGASSVNVLPSLPDLPVLSKHDPPFDLAPGEEARVYLRLPVILSVNVADRSDELLA